MESTLSVALVSVSKCFQDCECRLVDQCLTARGNGIFVSILKQEHKLSQAPRFLCPACNSKEASAPQEVTMFGFGSRGGSWQRPLVKKCSIAALN